MGSLVRRLANEWSPKVQVAAAAEWRSYIGHCPVRVEERCDLTLRCREIWMARAVHACPLTSRAVLLQAS
jgi:hypothetical protein